MEDVEYFPDGWQVCEYPDYHSVVSIQLCELANAGFFDLTDSSWDFGPKYSEDQHTNLCAKITAHFWYREISLVPPGVWKNEFLRKMNEIMPKYMPWYKALADDIRLGSSSEYYKSRNIFSDFPQTALAGENQDYASTGNDVEYERIHFEDPLKTYELYQSYQDVDMAIINEIEPLFSCLFSVNANGF